MKRISLVFALLLSVVFAGAQSLDDVNKQLNANDYKGAKANLDKFLSDPKNVNNSEALYYKGRAYNGLSYDNTVSQEEKLAYKIAAFEAFKKNQQTDPKDLRLTLESHKSYLDLYFGLYDLGAAFFNAKKYDEAFTSFTKALEVKDYILAKKYTYTEAKIYPLDTALVLNAAISATQAKKEDVALPYYKKLVDANVSGKGYEEVYEYLVSYYHTKDDQAALQPLLVKAKGFYPANEYWSDLELNAVKKTGDQAALFSKYEEMVAANPSSFTLIYNYSIEMFNSIYGRDAKPATKEMKDKLTENLKKAIALDPGIDASMVMTNHLFNSASDLSIEAATVKGTKPEDIKKRKELNAASDKLMNELLPYGDAVIKYFDAQTALKGNQRANFKIVLGYMADIYTAKKDLKKAAEYEKKRQAVDKAG